MARHRATALLDRADARLGAGDVDAACDDATMALNLVAQVEHTGHIGRIEGFAARARDADTRVARDLHEQVMLIRVDFGLSPGKEAT
jgi:hypothetical protein